MLSRFFGRVMNGFLDLWKRDGGEPYTSRTTAEGIPA
jgi:hypothetical protein